MRRLLNTKVLPVSNNSKFQQTWVLEAAKATAKLLILERAPELIFIPLMVLLVGAVIDPAKFIACVPEVTVKILALLSVVS